MGTLRSLQVCNAETSVIVIKNQACIPVKLHETELIGFCRKIFVKDNLRMLPLIPPGNDETLLLQAAYAGNEAAVCTDGGTIDRRKLAATRIIALVNASVIFHGNNLPVRKPDDTSPL